jgi:long-subunit acyl-CoA synthetase (AMP-forming)
VLNLEALPTYCKQKQVSAEDAVKLRELVTADVQAACRQAGLMGFEIPSLLNLQMKPFSIESGVLTATSKLVRGVAKQFFKAEITAMYKELGEDVKI